MTDPELLPMATAEPLPVQPLISPELAAKAWREFLELKQKLLDDGDYALIKGKKVIRKSGFRKLSVVFNLSDEIVEQEKTIREDDSFYWRVVTMVTAPNGRTSVGVGICDSNERKFAHSEHDVYSTAHTRSKNRAISDMIAGGVVSAEEMSNVPREEKNTLKKIVLKKPWTWNKIFAEFAEQIQIRQEELGPLFSFEQAAIVFVQEKGFTQELPQ